MWARGTQQGNLVSRHPSWGSVLDSSRWPTLIAETHCSPPTLVLFPLPLLVLFPHICLPPTLTCIVLGTESPPIPPTLVAVPTHPTHPTHPSLVAVPTHPPIHPSVVPVLSPVPVPTHPTHPSLASVPPGRISCENKMTGVI